MSALHVERSSTNTFGGYIKAIVEGFGYSIAALSLYRWASRTLSFKCFLINAAMK